MTEDFQVFTAVRAHTIISPRACNGVYAKMPVANGRDAETVATARPPDPSTADHSLSLVKRHLVDLRQCFIKTNGRPSTIYKLQLPCVGGILSCKNSILHCPPIFPYINSNLSPPQAH